MEKNVVFFKDFFTYLLLKNWHLACTWETWSSSLCFATFPSFHLISKYHWAKKSCWEAEWPFISGPCAKASCHFPAVLTIYPAMFRHAGVKQSFAQLPSLARKRARLINDNTRKRMKLQILRGNTLSFSESFHVGRISIIFITSFNI